MFKRVYNVLFAGKRKVFLGAPLTLLLLAGTAAAAWIVFSGASGSGNGTFNNATQQTAITINGTNQPALSPGASVPMSVQLVNNDTGNSHTLNTLTGTFTTSTSGCDAYLSIDSNGVIGTSVSAGGSQVGSVPIKLAANAPVSCAGGTWSVAFSGTTS